MDKSKPPVDRYGFFNAADLHSGWFDIRCEQCRKLAPVMEESDLCQECHDGIRQRQSLNGGHNG